MPVIRLLLCGLWLACAQRLFVNCKFVTLNEEVSIDDHLGLDVLPMKASKPLLQMETCFEMESPFEEGAELVFTINVIDTLPPYANTNRFGMTTKDKGKQSLNLQIENPDNGDLIRARKNLRSGNTVIEIGYRTNKKFKICLLNLSYDASWAATDTTKSIQLWLTANEINSRDMYLSQLRKEVRSDTFKTLDNCVQILNNLLQVQAPRQLIAVESERRDLNEQVFNRLLYSEIIFTIMLLISQCLMTYYFIREYKKASKKSYM